MWLLAQDSETLNPEQLTKLVETFASLGLVGGALFVIVLALIAFIVLAWINRNKDRPSSEAIKQLVAVNKDKDDDLEEMKRERAQEREELKRERELAREQHIESLTAIADAMNRHADISKTHTENEVRFITILETFDKREGERTDVLSRLTDTVEVMTRDGSEPLRQLTREVKDVLEFIRRIDSRTTNWETIAAALPDFKAKLEVIEANTATIIEEAKKHSTQPLPTVAHVLEETP